MPEPLVLQKLLTGSVAAAIVDAGSDQVGGYVTAAKEAVGLAVDQEMT